MGEATAHADATEGRRPKASTEAVSPLRIEKQKKKSLAQQIMYSSRSKLTLEEEMKIHKQKLTTEMKIVQPKKVDFI